ncbi:hypothetical protein DCG74_35945 [Bradyrhizobium sp. WBAH42]|nr:hypothetical protein [Bradyrhizobium sp. WBAH30]MDD1543375.1 hypothetical protein [Bradyrhizobium sp. WBAH41]MDD1557505.1 hypothetical protein [Bradyrhizobium sp. WBAH23]MDD1564917.1 hypothetical protein [Bradyrhizobium sp. WBAH33]MDD1590325.1 hypothetical protein [Bradyrhizobium sp. WBAH42]NRB88032.1 hypothetical protein [Bradyrhizobium sp. WBAH10]QCJ93494.1 hypothetical protein DAA57_37380 [Bradyrhizobium yuanmingense]
MTFGSSRYKHGREWAKCLRSSLRAERSNPESFRGGSLDCFAALAMTRRGPRFQKGPGSFADTELE